MLMVQARFAMPVVPQDEKGLTQMVQRGSPAVDRRIWDPDAVC